MDLSKHWKTIVDTLQDGILVVGPDGKILAMNPAAERLTGYRAEELIGKSCRELDCTGCEIIGKGSGERWCGLYARGDVRAKKCTITNKENRLVNVIKNASVLRDDNGNIIGAVETLTDMSEIIRKQQEIVELRKSLHLDEGYHGIFGKSMIMQSLYELIDNVGLTDAPVMIYGKSGTGKELVARAIHEVSNRNLNSFIKVNCASLNENLLESEFFGHVKGAYTGADKGRIGRFEAAHGGTIFLDEIGDIPMSTQVKLLRVLEEKEIERVGDHKPIKVDVRIISATNRNLDKLLAEGYFREDLFFRINVFPLRIPSLKERREDIPTIVQNFIRQNNDKTDKKKLGMTPEAMDKLIEYAWPGNVRELRNTIEYAFVLCPGGGIGINHLPVKIASGVKDTDKPSQPSPKKTDRKEELIKILRETGGNRSETARRLGVSRVTVWKRMKKYDINTPV
ncbi:MAG: sigma-54-dependent Fis family transcriptional regulator [Desulfobacteraceae bacterium A6]|nr:MAG: sigma-54-dependent Fis family transcriptional regulator [Desulfobacteraceae bacterium A6]